MLHNPVHEDVRLKVEQGFSLTHRVLSEDTVDDYDVEFTIDHWICNKEIIRILGASPVINGILILNESITKQLHGTYILNIRYSDKTSSEVLTQSIYVDIYR